jgi:plasmid stabilization system protein ParE
MKLRFTPRALRNLAEIADYLWARNPTAAVRVTDAIEHRLRNLLHFPYPGGLKKTRACGSS